MPITTTFDETRFRTLLERWNHHQDLRRSGASVSVLASSRIELDAIRASLRHG